ncbi:MAG: ATP-binding protein, partial [Cyanothece sp. SIO2G6]|nr:ATP-binding protein [Cyanothece sp. SIO2G6]
YDGKIPAYWHDYGAEIERVEHLRQAQAEQGPQDAIALDRYSHHLVDWVKCRIDRVFQRLYAVDQLAYLMVCQGAVYRRAVERSAWLLMLADQELDELATNQTFQALQRRYLLEHETTQHRVLYRLHNLIRRVALDHLSQL